MTQIYIPGDISLCQYDQPSSPYMLCLTNFAVLINPTPKKQILHAVHVNHTITTSLVWQPHFVVQVVG